MSDQRAEGVRVAHPLFQAGGGGSSPTSALLIIVGEVSVPFAASLNHLWHSALPNLETPTVKGKAVAYAGTFDGTAYAVAVWSDPVAPSQDDGVTVELRRFAIAPDAPRMTASRMLAVMARMVFVKFPNARRLISYQAVALHAGTIYKAAGWTNANTSKFAEWGTRRRRVRAAGFVVAPSTRKPVQIKSDKVRWELWRRGAQAAEPPVVRPAPRRPDERGENTGDLFSDGGAT